MDLFDDVCEKITLDRLQAHLNGRSVVRGCFKVLPPLRCANGTSLSVQASDYHRCAPQSVTGPYARVEIGCAETLDELVDFMCRHSKPGHVVYDYVPVEAVLTLINRRGGLSI